MIVNPPMIAPGYNRLREPAKIMRKRIEICSFSSKTIAESRVFLAEEQPVVEIFMTR
ncbi:hypothetical protein GGD83_002992 [Rhodoblastus sphagnicola]|uniref:hypothetical protein n=1 Tax=Rhodoblastus sphagnicola TaxID=333368 RepID=UPI00130498B3|nr:hypothetical protein [Rhodoblastus sphagnicola]MBB4199181.1 hypothetical protein [Rhodoblastus sphagnicola]